MKGKHPEDRVLSLLKLTPNFLADLARRTPIILHFIKITLFRKTGRAKTQFIGSTSALNSAFAWSELLAAFFHALVASVSALLLLPELAEV